MSVIYSCDSSQKLNPISLIDNINLFTSEDMLYWWNTNHIIPHKPFSFLTNQNRYKDSARVILFPVRNGVCFTC